MPTSPSSFRWAPHFEDPEQERFARLTFDGMKDLNAAVKSLNGKANTTQAQSTANAALLANISTQLQQITQNITNITNNTVLTGSLDCGTFSGF